MIKQLIVGFLLIGLSFSAISQDTITRNDELSLMKYEDSLGMLAHMLVNDSMDIQRFVAVKSFIPKLVAALKHKNSFQYPFKQLQRYISILYPPDSTFRIITWQIHGEAEYRNYGAIQMNTADLKLFPLIDRSETYPDIENVVLQPNEWFGAIYYKLMPLKSRKKMRYVLFGYDNLDVMTRRKVLDILSFEDGKPVFGAPVLHYPKKDITKHRLVLQYYSGATTTLNYDEDRKKIIYDHLITNKDKNGNVLSVSDGSYEGFKFKKGKLIHIDKVFHLKVEEPPMPYPVLDSRRSKDIHGRTKS